MTPQELREEFKKRYERSAIYDELYVDWFPDDVINWWLSKFHQHTKEMVSLIKEEEVLPGTNMPDWMHERQKYFNKGLYTAVKVVESTSAQEAIKESI